MHLILKKDHHQNKNKVSTCEFVFTHFKTAMLQLVPMNIFNYKI